MKITGDDELVGTARTALRLSLLSLALILSACHSKDGGQEPHVSAHARSFYARTGNPDRVIVFVHGIFGSPDDTWNCSSSVSWPKLIQDDDALQRSDIYVAGYDTPYFGNRMTIDEVVSNLKSRLDSDEVFTKHREVIFVAHSLGGLVVQRLLLTHRELAPQVKFIYFYSTPETGAQVAQLGHIFSSDPLLKEMFASDSNDYLLNLESEWRGSGFNIHRYCAYEKKPVKGILVVDRLSGTRGCENAIAINEDHISIVKPCDRNADSYIALRNAILKNPIVPEPPKLRTEVVPRRWESYQEVGCNHTNSNTLTASTTLDPSYQERVLTASASLENADNIQGVSGPTLGPVTGNTVRVTYGFNGKDAGITGCPGGGHATVVVTFSVERQVPVQK